jgi:hypothetical protein
MTDKIVKNDLTKAETFEPHDKDRS